MSTTTMILSAPEDCTDFYRQYLADISIHPPLVNNQDDRLVQQLKALRNDPTRQDEARAIVQQLIEGSLRLVIFVAARFYRYYRALDGGRFRVPLMDLIQTGNMALVECAHRYLDREAEHTDFSAYAASYIRFALRKSYIRASLFKVPQAEWDEAAEQGRLFQFYEVSSLDQPFSDESTRSLLDCLETPEPLSENTQACERAETLLARVPEREQQVVRLRYGLDPLDQRTHTYQEIADKIGASVQTCLNIEQRVLQALNAGTSFRTSSEYYSASEASSALGLSNTSFIERVKKGVIRRYVLNPEADPETQLGVYSKAEIDALAEEYQRVSERYYTLEEAAARLHLTTGGVKNWVQQGLLTRTNVPGRERYGGVYLKAEIDRIVEELEDFARNSYSLDETAARLGISKPSVHRWVREGRLRYVEHTHAPHGAYAKEDVDLLAKEQRTWRGLKRAS
ncbi:sigma-70 family RNA polymerase sigma factor [Ktedonobacter racemifer]|uniref:RNA polymerase sigma factor, sigma-70 family n=1 Tax=Ktedonobacter racemifer DSM 44963 TaxID=485913 RepID=D6TGH5_KTERA|nr:sigma-70 family RNA polymerase sigma factor [Ktedonobacter racemifer]EFH90687.1 RNA polymerase sigma factor, sigma-70 family [Ktedonobacter racemifer DSM 44963]